MRQTHAMRAIWCAGLLLATAASPAYTQRPQPVVQSPDWVRESWSIADGLPVNSVNALLQSRDGYIWAATFDGLVRFDGVRFTIFNTANSPGLPSDRIISMLEAKDGSLWLNTEQRFLVHFKQGRFTYIDKRRGIDGNVWMIREDAAGTLWVATERGVGRIRDGNFERVASDAIPGNALSLAPSGDGGMWVGTRGGGVFKVTANAARRMSRGLPFDTTVVETLFEDSAGRLWLAGGRAAYRVDDPAGVARVARWPIFAVQKFLEVPTTRTMYVYSSRGMERVDSTRLTPILAQWHLYTYAAPMQLHGADSVWLALDRNLYLNGRLIYTLTAAGREPVGRIIDLLLDREGGIWLASEGQGLIRLRRSLFNVYGATEGLDAQNAYAVARDASDAIWVGSTLNGLSRIAPDRRSITNFHERPLDVVGSILPDGPNRLLVSVPYGLHACSTPSMQCSASVLPPFDLLQQWSGVYALHRTADGRVLAGSHRNVFERKGTVWRPLAGWNTPHPARAFADGRDGALWIGTNGGGVARCDAGRCRAFTTADGLPSDIIRSLHVDDAGWLWIGTEGRGLARLDARGWPADDAMHRPAVVTIGVTDGLYDPVVHQMLDDGLGRLWMSSNRGIFWVTWDDLRAFADGRVSRLRSVAYTERDGLRNREANGGFQPAGVRDGSGRLWFPTQVGAVSIDPKAVPTEQPPPPVVVEQLRARDRLVTADTGTVQLAATERDLEIAYTALTFREPRNVRFRYRLEPYDADWVDAGSRRTAFYTRVPPGRYTFRVAASQGGDSWSEEAATIAFRVQPYFRETLTAKLLLAAALALTGVLAFRWRVQALRQREAMLTALVQDRTAALRRNEQELAAQNSKLEELNQLRSRLFANLSHEFRTPLTLILGPLRSLLDGRHGTLSQSVRQQGELMHRNGQRLLRLINQVLDLARLQAGAVSIARQPLELIGFVRTVTQAFAPLADRHGIAVAFRSPLRTLTVAADHEQLEKVLLNLLSNAVKFTEAGGIVDVSVARNDDDALIVVRDTGTGIAADELPRIFERFYQVDSAATRRYDGTGIGLALVRELVELHGGEIRVASVEGEGSTFTVRLPIGAVADGVHRPAVPFGAVDELLAIDGGGVADGAPQEESADDQRTVLLIDDNADVRTYVRSVLAPTFHVLEAADGAAGLILAREALPDLIVADVMMPELDGLQLGRALKADPMTDAIPLILLTARAAAEDQIAGLDAGADSYLLKPFDPGVLTACVENLLQQRRRLRERFRIGEDTPPVSLPAAPSALDLRLRPLVQSRLLDPDLSPEVLAAAAELSYHQLYRALRDELGTTPSRYIRTVRAECAAELLRRGAGSVTEVAYAVGFESLSYFRRAFRERFDRTPSDFLTGDPGLTPRS